MPPFSEIIRIRIEQKIKAALAPVHLCIVDETEKHIGHRGATAGKGHFILHVVSDRFEGIPLLNRNRMIFATLKEEMTSEIHALSIQAMTPSEWKSSGAV